MIASSKDFVRIGQLLRPANAQRWLLVVACALGIPKPMLAAPVALDNVLVIAPAQANTVQRAALDLLVDEAYKRTGRRWLVRFGVTKYPVRVNLVAAREYEIAELLPPTVRVRLKACDALKRDEGFSIRSLTDGKRRWIIVSGHDDRGMLFGLGRLLRKTDWSGGHGQLDTPTACVAPDLEVRGHQLGYRAKSNTYDGWTVAQFEQYLRDLAVFGANTVELLAPVTDDSPSSPLFPQPALDTMIGVSALIRQYGLRCSVFYPALARDYTDPDTVSRELDAWENVLRQLPQVDELFVPGGDPGDTPPAVLFAFLDKLAPRLRRHHPNATIWVSAQGFDAQRLESFYQLVAQRPRWLGGVVFGPQSREPLATLRARIPSNLPIRLYPDIAHTHHSQFPVPHWDPTWALTEGREPINPQPQAQTRIFRHFVPGIHGFVTYSEGVNDDVNKFVWTALGVEPRSDPADALADYARWFAGRDLGAAFTKRFAVGLEALEHNWDGSVEGRAPPTTAQLRTESNIQSTLRSFREIERRRPQAARRNWRVQLALYRAWFDAYEQNRALLESDREREALKRLARAPRVGSLNALAAAERALLPTDTLAPMRAHIEELAGALFESIRIQLSAHRYGASAVGRGANLDTIDVSLNDRAWLEGRFAEIRGLPEESQRLAAIRNVLNYESPVPGAYYDDLGEPGREPHLVRNDHHRSDPDLRYEPHDGIADVTPDVGWRRSWVTYAGALYDEPLILAYEDLNPRVHYRVRITYAGEDYALPTRLVANGRFEIHPSRNRHSNPETVEFDIPREATVTGKLKLAWTRSAGLGGSGRGAQVAEVWLLPLPGR
jgi:hypothetical protein